MKKTHDDSEDNIAKFTKDNFSNFNFPKQNDGSFTVFVQNELADQWEEALEKKYGDPIIESSVKGLAFGKNWKPNLLLRICILN